MKAQRIGFGDICQRLRELEKKYGFSTIEFYRRYEAGELNDGEDFMTWAGFYHMYLTSLPVRQFMQTELKSA